jgi:hypothetical protein
VKTHGPAMPASANGVSRDGRGATRQIVRPGPGRRQWCRIWPPIVADSASLL